MLVQCQPAATHQLSDAARHRSSWRRVTVGVDWRRVTVTVGVAWYILPQELDTVNQIALSNALNNDASRYVVKYIKQLISSTHGTLKHTEKNSNEPGSTAANAPSKVTRLSPLSTGGTFPS